MNVSTKNYEIYENFGIHLESDNFCSAYNGFSAKSDKNHQVSYTNARSTTSNYKHHSTTSFATESTSYNSQSIGHNANNEQQMILEQNLPTFVPQLNRPPIKAPSMTNANSLQIQIEIPGYTMILIPKSSPLASLTGLDVQHQLQPNNNYSSYSVIPPQLNQEKNYSFPENGYESTPSPLKNLTSLDVQHQLQPNNIYLDDSPYSVIPPQINQEKNYSFPENGYESTPSPLKNLTSLDVQHQPNNIHLDDSPYSVILPQLNQEQSHSFTANGYESTPSPLKNLTSLDVQHQPGNVRLDSYSYSVNPPQHYFSGSGETSFFENIINNHNHVSNNVQPNVNDKTIN
ncbi:9878_t:CDS:1 [Funneliformis caledonium]|uniref:9878_t:CDS:1 n=1 Tax=Funneliformis caledonium TaxID=1117310 RepID=A0A9N9FXH8_9GLOM|nr:9878_t:CDS:1 [Funneliformis caledonium]